MAAANNVTPLMQQQVAGLYLTYFNRAPEASGFATWTQQLANGASPWAVADTFSKTDEFKTAYNGLTAAQKVTKLYVNLLNRAPDASGLEYWVGQLSSNSIGQVAWQMFNSAYTNSSGTGAADQALVQNKCSVGVYYAAVVGGTDIAQAQNAYNLVTSNPASVAQAESTMYKTAYTLTTGVDAVTASGSFNAVNGTGTTFTAGDSITVGGVGIGNTLNVNDTTGASAAGVPAGVSVSGIQTANIKASGSIGNAGTPATPAVPAARQVQTITPTVVTTGTTSTIAVTYGGVTVNTAPLDGSATAVEVCNLVAGAINAIAGSTVATTVGSQVVVTAPVAGTPLPTITTALNTTPSDVTWVQATAQANNAGSAAIPAIAAATYDVSGWTGLTDFNGTSVGGADLKVASTVNVNETNATSGLVKVVGGAAVTVSNADSVSITGSKGAISVTTTAAPTTTFAAKWDGTNSTTVAGVFVTGGTTVSITESAGTSTSGSAPAGNATAITVGAAATKATNATTGQETIDNLSSIATGNVTTSVKTAYTDANGKSNVKYGTGAATVFTNGATAVSITGAGATGVTDIQTTLLVPATGKSAVAGTSTLSTVNLTGVSGTTNLTSDVISTLSVVDTSATVNVLNSGTKGANTGPLALTVGNSTTTVADATHTSINVTAVPSAYQYIGANKVGGSTLTLTAGAATALSFTGTADVKLGASTVGVLSSITDTSAGVVDLQDVSSYSKLSSINASGATGALKAIIGATGSTVGMSVTSGSGNDVIQLKAGNYGSAIGTGGATITTTVNLGSGNDTLVANAANFTGSGATGVVNAAAVIGAGTVLNGGVGVDKVSASIVNAGNQALFNGFDVLDLTGFYVTDGTTGVQAGKSIDASIFTNSSITGISNVGLFGSAAAATQATTVTVSNLINNSTVEIGGFVDQTTQYTGALQNITQTHVAGASTTAFTFNAAPTSAAAAGHFNAAQVGTFTTTADTAVTINSTGGSNISFNGISSLVTTDNALTTITITGDKAFYLGGASTYSVSTPSVATASSLTLIDGSQATGDLTITAGATSSTYITYTGLTINGGLGADTITINAKNGVVNGGVGNDTLAVGSAVTGVTLTGGAGNDLFNVAAATTTVTSGVGNVVTVVADAAAGDTIKLAVGSSGNTFVQDAVNVNAATNLNEAFNIAAASGSSTANVNVTKWFTWGNDTYLVEAHGTGSAITGLATGDVVVKLTGIHDLSSQTMTSGTAVLTLA